MFSIFLCGTTLIKLHVNMYYSKIGIWVKNIGEILNENGNILSRLDLLNDSIIHIYIQCNIIVLYVQYQNT